MPYPKGKDPVFRRIRTPNQQNPRITARITVRIAMLRMVTESSFGAFLQVLHYLAAIPLFSARSWWISKTTGVSIETVSEASCGPGLNLIDAANGVRQTIVPQASCGLCESKNGNFEQGEDVVIFGRNGCKRATVFDFKCDACGAVSGPTTTVVATKKGETPRHVVSRHISRATVFLPQRKPRQRHDEQVGFDRALLEEFTDHAATHKTFESFSLVYNRTQARAAHAKGEKAPRKLDDDSFRHSWFLCHSFEKGMSLGMSPGNTLDFTKTQLGGAGNFELYLEELNIPSGRAFTSKYANHREDECGCKHQALIGDGHCKTHFVTCSNKKGKIRIASSFRLYFRVFHLLYFSFFSHNSSPRDPWRRDPGLFPPTSIFQQKETADVHWLPD